MPKHVLTVTLNPAIDKIIKVKNFSVGRDFRSEDITLSAGGKGVNVSRVLKSLGRHSIATGFIGGTTGKYIKEELGKEKIQNDFLEIRNETRTNLTILDQSTHKITRVLEQGPRITSFELKRFKNKFSSLLKNCSVVIFSGSIAPGLPESIYFELIKIAQKKNVKTVLDTSGKSLVLGLQAKPFLIKPNLEEAQYVLGKRVNSVSKIKDAIQRFPRLGIKIIILSLGEEGAVALNGKEIIKATAPRLKCENNVGCGDALLGGFITAQQKNQNFKDSLRFAVACGASNVLSIKPGLINPRVVKKLVKQIKIKDLSAFARKPRT